MRDLKIYAVQWIIVLASLLIMGCGAPSGTGLDFPAGAANTKTVSLGEVLAVDDLLVEANLEVGKSLATDGTVQEKVTEAQIVTGTDGKTVSFSIAISPETTTLYFQTRGGKNGPGGPTLGDSIRFTGVIELDGSSTTQNFPRVNINPFTSLISYTKAKSPALKISDIAGNAVSSLFSSTAVALIDINSAQYSGASSNTLETTGDGVLFQLVNEMIRKASDQEAGSSGPEKLKNFTLKVFNEVTAGENLFTSGNDLHTKLSAVSAALSTNTSVFGNFFSQALSVLSTSSTASVRPTSFASRPAGSDFLTVGSTVLLDNTTAVISSVTSGVALITAQSATAISIASLPAKIRLDLSQNQYKVALQSDLEFRVEKASDNYVRAVVDQVVLDARDPFTLVVPAGAQVAGTQVKPDSQVSLATKNSSEDRFVSAAGFLDFPVAQLIEKAETTTGQTLSISPGSTILIEVKFSSSIRFRLTSGTQDFHTIRIPVLQITG